MRNETRKRNLASFLASFICSSETSPRSRSIPVTRKLHLEPLESRQLLSSVSLLDDGLSDLAVVRSASSDSDPDSVPSFENNDNPSVLNASGSGLDLPRNLVNSGSLSSYFTSVSYYQAMNKTLEGSKIFLNSSSSITIEFDLSANKAANIVLQPTPGLLACGPLTMELLDSSDSVVSVAEAIEQAGTTRYYFPTFENMTTKNSFTIRISRAQTGEGQLCYYWVYESDISKAGVFAEVEGSFAASLSPSVNSYTYSLSSNTSSSICVYAPQSHNLSVELYNSSGVKIAEAINQGEGYYSIPCFVNSGSSNADFSIKLTGGGSGAEEKYELTVSQDAGAASGAGSTISSALDLASFRKSGTSTSVVLGSVNSTSSDLSSSKQQLSLPTGTTDSKYFGTSVSYDGGYLAVGSPRNASSGSISLYTPNLNDSGWSFLRNLSKPSSGLNSNDLGTSVDISGQWIVAGTPANKVNSVGIGSAFVYNISTGIWSRLDMSSFASELSFGSAFGQKVCIYGDWLFVQAKNGQSDTSDLLTGAVYAYHLKSNGTWEYIQKLVGEIDTDGAVFGCAMACDGQTLAIGAKGDSCLGEADGSVTIYTLFGDRWKQTQKLLTSDAAEVDQDYVQGGAANGISFGSSIALSEGTLAIGAPGYNKSGSNGIVGVFQKKDGLWTGSETLFSTDKLTGVTIHAFSNFGASLDISQDLITVGGNVGAGAVYTYRLNSAQTSGSGTQTKGGSWELTNIIDGNSTGGTFASQVVIAGDRLIISDKPDWQSDNQNLYSYSELGKTDCYSFTLGSSAVTVTLNPQGEATLADFDVFFMNSSGERLVSGSNNGLSLDMSNGMYKIMITPTYWAKDTYYVCVRAQSGKEGDYILEMTKGVATTVSGVSTNVVDGGYMNELPGEIIFRFTDAINLENLSAGSMTIGSQKVQLTSGNYRLIDGRSLAVSTPSGYSPAAGSLDIALTGLKDLRGQNVETVDLSVVFDKSSPTINGSSSNIVVDSGSGVQLKPGTTAAIPQAEDQTLINIVFSEDMDFPATQARIHSWVKITGTNSGAVDFTVSQQGSKSLQIVITGALPDDSYTLTLSENFTDKSGLALSESAQTLHFAVNSTNVMPLPTLKTILINGSRGYQSSVSGNISGTETDRFSFSLAGGNTYSVYAIPTDSSLNLKMFASAANLASNTSGSYSGSVCYSENIKVASDTDLEIAVEGANSTTGNYTLLVVVNGVADINPTGIVSYTSSSQVPGYNWSANAECSVFNYWGNVSSFRNTTSTSKNIALTVRAEETLQLTMNPEANSGAQVEVYSDSGRSQLLAKGYVNDSGLIVIDPLVAGASETTYYLKLTGLSSEYQLTAVKNGILNLESSSETENLQSGGRDISVLSYVKTAAFGSVSQLPGSITVENMQNLVEASSGVSGTAASVAVSDRWAVIGGVSRTTGAGCVYIYEMRNGAWVYVTTVSQAGKSAQGFGQAVSLEGDCLAVSAPGATLTPSGQSSERSCGAVYLYRFVNNSWVEKSIVTPSDACNGMEFGASVSLSGGQLAVGAPESRNSLNICGAVYLYSLNTGSGTLTATETQRLTAGRTLGVENRDYLVSIGYGSAIDMNGNYLIVGSPSDAADNTGAAFFYKFDGLRWNLISALSPSGDDGAALEYGDAFGFRVAIGENYAAVSAPNAGTTGRVYIYSLSLLEEKVNNIGLNAVPTVLESNNSSVERFGSSLAFEGEQLFVGGFKAGTSETSALWGYGLSSSGTWAVNTSNYQLFDSGSTVIASSGAGFIAANTDTGDVYAYGNSSDSDRYSYTTKSSGSLIYSLTSQQTGKALGINDLSVSIYDSEGNLVQFSYDSSTKKYTSTSSEQSAGTYTAYIYAKSGESGDYVFRVYSALNMEAADNLLKVESVQNGWKGYVQSVPSQIEVRFNSSLNLQTLSGAVSAGQILVNGTVVSSYNVLDGTTVSFTIPSGAAANSNGEYVLTFNGASGSSGLKNTFGGSIGTDEQAVLTVDSTPVAPSFVRAIPATSTANAIIELDLGSETLRGAVDLSQLKLTGAAHGEIALNGAYVYQNGNSWRLLLQTTELPDDYYTLTLKTSEYALADMAGNLINNGQTDLTIKFEANISSVQTIQYDSTDSSSSDFALSGDESSLSYQAQVSGFLSPGQTDSWEVKIPGGNSLMVLLSGDTRDTTTLKFKRNGNDATYDVVRTSTGQYACLYNSSDSTYQILVDNSSPASGVGASYTLDLLLNNQRELETFGGGVNDSFDKAEDLTILGNSILKNGSSYQTEVAGQLGANQDKDWYKFTVSVGELYNFYLSTSECQNLTLELYNSNRQKIASGVPSGVWSQAISSFREISVDESFTYYLCVSGSAGQYKLHALRNLDLNADGQDCSVESSESVIGRLSGSEENNGSDSSFLPQTVLGANELTRGSLYGSTISVNGDLMIVGAPKGSQSELNEGFAAIYRYSNSVWTLDGVLQAPESAYGDFFGSSVSIHGNLAIVSAVGRANGLSSGQAFIYEYSNGVWNYSSTIKNSGDSSYTFGGNVLVLDDNTIVVSGTQNVLIFRKSYSSSFEGYVWSASAVDRISAPSTYRANGFGSSLAVSVSGSETTLVVGAPETGNGSFSQAGMVFVYTNSGTGTGWELKSALSLSDNSLLTGDQNSSCFGQSVSIDGSRLAVGAPGYGANASVDDGVVYLYSINNGAATFQQSLENESNGSCFGSSVSLFGDYLAVGAPQNAQAGSISVYYNNGLTWSEVQEVTSRELSGAFGTSIALSDGRLMVGAPGQTYTQNGAAVRSGVVYSYSLTQSNEIQIQVESGQQVQASWTALKTPDANLTGVKYQYRQAGNASSEWISVTGSTFTPNFTGACLVRLSGTSGSGEYAVKFSGLASSGALSAPTASIAAGSEISPFESGLQIKFQFSEPMRLDKLGNTSIGIDGGLGITYPGNANWSLSAEGKTLTVNIPKQNKANFISNQMTLILDKDCFVSVSGKEYSSDVSFGYLVPIDTVKTLTQTTVAEDSVQVSVEFDLPMKLIDVVDPADWRAVVSVLYTDSNGMLQTVSAATLGATVEYVAETQSLSVELPSAGLAQLPANGACSVSLDALKVVAEDGTHLNNIESMAFGVPFVNSAAESLTVTIAATTRDTVSNAPADSIWVDEWSNVWVEIWGQANSGSGFGQVALRVADKGGLYNWATENGNFVFEAGASFQGTNGSLTCQQDGEYLTLTGTTSVSGVGNGFPVLIGRIKCVPESGNNVALSTMNDGQFPDWGIQVYGQGTAAANGGGSLNINVSNSSTKVVPVVYDLAEDGSVNMSDFIKFAQSFNATATIGNESWYADFNRNGKVDMTDFIQFAQNFNASQAKGSRLSYSSDFISWMDSCVENGTIPSAQSASAAFAMDVSETAPLLLSVSGLADARSNVEAAPVAVSQNVPVLLDASGEETSLDMTASSVEASEPIAPAPLRILETSASAVVLRSQRQAITGLGSVSSPSTGTISNLLFPISVTYGVSEGLEFPQIAPQEAHNDLILEGYSDKSSETEDDWLDVSGDGLEKNEDQLSPIDQVLHDADWQWLDGKLEEDD